MLKGIVTGTLVGAVAMAAVLKWRDARAESGRDKPGAIVSAAGDDLAKLREEADQLKAARAALEAEIAAEDARLAAVDLNPGGTGKKKKPKKAATWKEIAPKIMLLMPFGERAGEEMSEEEREKLQEEAQMAMLGMMALLGDIAKKRGITIDEAMYAPEGLPEMLLESVLGSKTPPTPEQEKVLRDLVAKYSADYAGWHDLDQSKLEMKLAQMGASDAFVESFNNALDPSQRGATESARMFGEFNMGGGGGHFRTTGDHDEVLNQMTSDWAKSMKFDPAQGSSISPIVEEYMRACDAADARQMPSNEGNTVEGQREVERAYREVQKAKTLAQIEAQRKLSSMATTPEQKKAVRGWVRDYSWRVGPSGLNERVEPMESPEDSE